MHPNNLQRKTSNETHFSKPLILTKHKYLICIHHYNLKTMNTKNKINIGLLIAASALPSSALQANPGSKLAPVYLLHCA